jgi:hypothetical protein
MPRLVRLAKGKLDHTQVGVAVDPADFDKTLSFDGEKTWKAAGYKLTVYDDTGEPYEAPQEARAVPRAAEEKAEK